MKSVLLKDTVKEIKNTFKRFLSILLVVLLGVGFFAGIKATSPDMKITLDKYFDDQNVMDIQVISTLGLKNKDLESLKNVEGVESIEGTYAQDVIVSIDEEDAVIKMETISDKMNQLVLIDGKLPENTDECVVENNFLSWSGLKMGDTIHVKAEKITDDEENKKEVLKQDTMRIVGVIKSPIYISRERGNSKLGSGRINYYMYISKEATTTDLYTNAYVQVAKAKELACYEDEYEDLVNNVADKIEEISEERKQARYEEIYNEANRKIQDAEKTLNDEKSKAEKEIQDAKNKLDKAKKEIKNGKRELESNRKKANTEFANAEKKLKEAKQELNKQLEKFEAAKKEAEKQIKANKENLENLKELANQGVQVENLSSTITVLNNGIKQAEKELDDNEKKLNTAKSELQKRKNTLASKKKSTYTQFSTAEKKISDGEKEVTDNEKKLANAEKEADEKIAEAEEKLEEAKLKLDDIKKPEWYILDRNQNTGYTSYMQDADRVANLATVFPAVFFIVAALISLTSMSRMVEEERVQIGTLKALGYTKIQIASKYLIYAILATIIGSIIGLVIGFNILPKIIITMYRMMYIIPDPIVDFNMEYTIISVSLAILCTVGATVYSCIKELKNTPANLMRPKAPKPGKRVFLENIKLIWSHLSFTQKVTARNIFRYKKRFLMTIIGVMGCTALILAGFGLRDSISKMIPSQYGEIFKYNVQISLKDNLTTKQITEEKEKIKAMEEIAEVLETSMQSIEITNIENTQNIQLIIPKNASELSKFITLQSRVKKNENYTLDESGVIITEKLAKVLNLKAGDTIKIKNADDIEVETKIANITENYLMHYMYMTPKLYKTLYGEEFKANTILANTNESANEEELGRKLLENNKYTSGVVFTSNTEDVFSEIMENLNLVVWVLIIAAGLLAFVVLYNLSNTNISERIRELATIKVLGFYDKEVYDYVSKETNILTVIGILIGLAGGYFLTMFIIKTCELDILMFDKTINWVSYVYAILITIAFAGIVNIATHFALKKIDMIESLKSIE